MVIILGGSLGILADKVAYVYISSDSFVLFGGIYYITPESTV